MNIVFMNPDCVLQGNNGNNIGMGPGSNPGPGVGPQMKPDQGNMLPTSPGSNILPASMISSLSDFADDAMSLGSHHSLAGRPKCFRNKSSRLP